MSTSAQSSNVISYSSKVASYRKKVNGHSVPFSFCLITDIKRVFLSFMTQPRLNGFTRKHIQCLHDRLSHGIGMSYKTFHVNSEIFCCFNVAFFGLIKTIATSESNEQKFVDRKFIEA